jgi:hypothetical protein
VIIAHIDYCLRIDARDERPEGAARAEAPADTLEIRLASGTALEQRGREQLERLLATHDLSRWLLTRTVQI